MIGATGGNARIDPLVIPRSEFVIAIGGGVTDIVAPAARPSTVAQLCAQDVGGLVHLALTNVEELPTATKGGQEIGDNAT